MKKVQSLVIVCYADKITDDVLAQLNYVLEHNVDAEQVTITQLDVVDIAKSIAKSAIQISAQPSPKKASAKLNNALNIVGERLSMHMNTSTDAMYFFIVSYTKEKTIHDAFKEIAKHSDEELMECPASHQYPYTGKIFRMIRQISNDL